MHRTIITEDQNTAITANAPLEKFLSREISNGANEIDIIAKIQIIRIVLFE